VRCDPQFHPAPERDARAGQVGKPPGQWGFLITLDALALKQSEPVATVMQVMDTAQGLGPLRTPLFMVLTELFSNALEHGLLGLDSEMKQGPNGFAEYYETRQQRLEQLESAQLTIECRHVGTSDGGELTIAISHTGSGFDSSQLPTNLEHNLGFKGRGIRLVRSLCDALDYFDEGRKAVAIYRWSLTSR
jgi:two-component sensor histidine kinase